MVYGVLTVMFVLVSEFAGWPWPAPAVKQARAAETVIASAGTIGTATKNSVQNKLFFDGTRWWAFYMKSGTANTLFYAYSTDLVTWTEASTALGGTVTQDGGTIDAYYDAGTGTVLVTYYSDTNFHRYLRGNISGTTITWSANTLYYDSPAKDAAADYTTSLAIDSNNIVWAFADDTGSNDTYYSTNPISTTFADTEANGNWTDTGPPSNNYEYMQKTVILRLASGGILQVDEDHDAGGNPLVQWQRWNGSTWSGWSTTGLIAAGANVSETNWGIKRIDDTHIYFLGQSDASTLFFSVFGGTSWDTSKAQPTWPTSGLATNSQIALTSDGTDVRAFVIRGDANDTVSYNKYTVASNSWGGWTDLTSTAATRAYISPAFNTSAAAIPVLWTQTNGSNYDIVVGSLNLPGGGGTAATSRSDILSDSRPSATSNHTVAFTINNSLDTVGWGSGSGGDATDTLSVTFPSMFNLANVQCKDVDISFGGTATSIAGYNTNRSTQKDCPGSATSWGLFIDTTANALTFYTPTTVRSYIATGTKVTIAIGTNATFQDSGTAWITNPSAAGVYTISVGGTFGGSGNIPVSINSGVTVAATVAESLAFSVRPPAFPTTGILDNFNRANTGPPPSANWTQGFGGLAGQFKVVSNQLVVNSIASGSAGDYWNPSTFKDSEEYLTVVTKPADGNYVLLLIRVVDPSVAAWSGYFLNAVAAVGTDTIQLYRETNGSATQIAVYNQEFSNGDSIGISAIGSTITAYYLLEDVGVRVVCSSPAARCAGPRGRAAEPGRGR